MDYRGSAEKTSKLSSLMPWRKKPSRSPQDKPNIVGASSQLDQFKNPASPATIRSDIPCERLLVPQEDTHNPLLTPSPNPTRSTSPQPEPQKWGLFHLNPTPPHNDSLETQNTTYPIDIVAMHGITGSAFDTWTFPDGAFWLKDFLPKTFPGARVFSYGYPAGVFFSKEKGDIKTFARTLLEKLCRERQDIAMRRRPIIFICHSMGGIVVKQALITAKIESDEYGSILKSVTDILFFATPHRGAENVKLLARMASIVNTPTRGLGLSPTVRSDLLKGLEKESKELYDISTSFRKLLPDLRIVSFVEKRTMLNLNKLIVDEDTAVMMNPRETIKHMDGSDHGSICRFADESDENYKDVLYSLREAALKATNKILDEMNVDDMACLNTLAYPEMFHRSLDTAQAAPGTCRWILRHPSFTTWMQQSRGLLWVKGKPGSGKSTLMAFVYSDFQLLSAQRTQVNLSFFFHGRGTLLQKSAAGMFRTLLHQLYKLSACARRIILLTFKEKMPFGEAGKGWEWHARELQDLFSRAMKEVPQWREVTVFVDALDEAGSNAAAELVSYFHQLNDAIAADTGASAKICISCRHYPVVTRGSGLEILVEQENRCDIVGFVNWRLKELQPQPDYPLFMEKRHELRSAIVEKAGDSFQWVSLMMPTVIEMLKDGEAFEDVERMIAERSSDLFATYEDILKAVDPRNRRRALLLLQWVCFAEQPLSVTELRFALACDTEVLRPDQVRCEDSKGFVESDGRMRMLANSLSGGLLEVRRHEMRDIVQVCHQTVNDFLTSGGLRLLLEPTEIQMLDLKCVIGRSEDQLSQCCINYLKLGEVLEGEFLERKALEGDHSWGEEVFHKLPFIKYATKYWFIHAQRAEENGNTQEGIVQQFRAKPKLFKSWTEIYEIIDSHADRCPDPGSSLIHIACASNLRSTVSALLESGVSIEEETAKRNRPLHFAARWGHEELTAMLLDANADVEAQSWHGATPLERAVAHQHEAVVKTLLDHGVDVNKNTGRSGTALISASVKGPTSLVRLLIDKGANVNAQAQDLSNSLQAAAYGGNLPVVRLLLDEGVDINVAGRRWGSPLQAATMCGHEHSEAIVRLLLCNRADINVRGGVYYTALQAAARSDKVNAQNLVPILLDHGAEVNLSGGHHGTALQAAALVGHDIVVRMLLDQGADVNIEGGIYGNPLQAAALRGHDHIVRLLLASGSKVDAGGGAFGNALQAAALHGYDHIVRLLLASGSKVDAVGGLYGNALQAAAYGGSKPVIELLLDHGADINAQGGHCGTALEAAAFNCSGPVMKYLIDRGAKVNTQIGEYGKVLVAAISRNTGAEIIQMLLDNGVDVNAAVTGKYATALQAASAKGDVALVKLLLDRGANPSAPGGLHGDALHIAQQNHNEGVANLLREYMKAGGGL